MGGMTNFQKNTRTPKAIRNVFRFFSIIFSGKKFSLNTAEFAPQCVVTRTHQSPRRFLFNPKNNVLWRTLRTSYPAVLLLNSKFHFHELPSVKLTAQLTDNEFKLQTYTLSQQNTVIPTTNLNT